MDPSESSRPPAADRIAEFPPEMQVLLCCARVRLAPEQRERLATLLRGGVDPDLLLWMAERHGMVPLLHLHLAELDPVLPSTDFRRRLHDRFRANAGRQLKLTAELTALLGRLESAGVAAVPYKGPALAARLYGSLVSRQSCDLDVVVRRDDVERAREALLQLGYTPRQDLTADNRAFMLASRYSEGFINPAGTVVELHWAFTNGDVALALNLDDLLPRTGTTRIGRLEARAFSAEDLLLILCVHGAKHLWARLEWICGVAELIRASPDLRWADVLDRAARLGVQRMLFLGLGLAHGLLGAPLQPALVERIRRNRHVRVLRGEVELLLNEQDLPTESREDFGSLRHDLFHFRLRERLRDQIGFVLYRVTTPSRAESWRTARIGGLTVPLHALTRPMKVGLGLVPSALRYLRRRRGSASTRAARSLSRSGSR